MAESESRVLLGNNLQVMKNIKKNETRTRARSAGAAEHLSTEISEWNFQVGKKNQLVRDKGCS
jgi:hypothetical protein